jgi:predicted amidophosphoribosyltransferase
VAVVLVDDIVTTGVTIAAASAQLGGAQLGGVAFAAVLAATQRHAHVLHRT